MASLPASRFPRVTVYDTAGGLLAAVTQITETLPAVYAANPYIGDELDRRLTDVDRYLAELREVPENALIFESMRLDDAEDVVRLYNEARTLADEALGPPKKPMLWLVLGGAAAGLGWAWVRRRVWR